jgi:acetyltransferase-like isoleucine patch superfamily enzyme
MIKYLKNKIQSFINSQVRIEVSKYYSRILEPNITVGENSFIDETAIVKCNQGGSIAIGNNCHILHGVLILTYGGNIVIDDNCSINPYSIIYGHGGLKIGKNVRIAAQNIIIPANHNFEYLDIPIVDQGLTSIGIEIQDNIWIGAGCKILDGVTLESGSIIAAGSVVNKNVLKNQIVGGIPAKLIKNRDDKKNN